MLLWNQPWGKLTHKLWSAYFSLKNGSFVKKKKKEKTLPVPFNRFVHKHLMNPIPPKRKKEEKKSQQQKLYNYNNTL